MNFKLMSREELDELIDRDLAAATAEDRALFARVAVPPTKWQLSPWGDPGGGFWVVAVLEARVLWYNDIEDGFNVSSFVAPGTIPSEEYWCNQDELRWALRALVGNSPVKLGPPKPIA